MTGDGALSGRISVPPSSAQVPGSLGWDRVIGPAETVLKHYADRNIGPGAFDPNRALPRLFIARDQGRGVSVPAQLRYTKLGEDLGIIGKYAGMGFEIYADTDAGRWVFEVIEGADRTNAQSAVSPVVLSIGYKNLEDYRYVDNRQNYRNTGYAGGQGQDENRLIYIVGAQNTGWDRFEVFLDCGGAANITELMYYGNLKLEGSAAVRTLEVTALPKTFVFDRDYFLGDKVSIIISRIGLELDTRLESVTESWERSKGHTVAARFGDKVPNILTILRNRNEVL
jgi:hypothetical protein